MTFQSVQNMLLIEKITGDDLMENQTEYFTLQEVAKKLKISDRQVYNLIIQGKLEHHQIGGTGNYRFTQDQLDKCLAVNKDENNNAK